jgi:hypothetical protein
MNADEVSAIISVVGAIIALPYLIYKGIRILILSASVEGCKQLVKELEPELYDKMEK